jgi:hypothetical protein
VTYSRIMASLDHTHHAPAPFALIAAVTGAVAVLGGGALAFWVFMGGTLSLDFASVFCF